MDASVSLHPTEVTGDLGIFIFDDKTTVIDVVVEPVPVPVTRRPVGFWKRAVLRAAVGVVRTLIAVKRALTKLGDPIVWAQTSAQLRLTYRAFTYQPRHKAGRYWYGRQRSTAETVASRTASARAAAKEGELPSYPDEFISWFTNFIETLRAEQDALHPHAEGQHFVCS